MRLWLNIHKAATGKLIRVIEFLDARFETIKNAQVMELTIATTKDNPPLEKSQNRKKPSCKTRIFIGIKTAYMTAS
jgi:hypothetical protein